MGRALPLFAVLLVVGCHGDSNPLPQLNSTLAANKASAMKPGPTPEELTAGMVEAVPLGKSTVPLAVKFDLPERPTVGQPLDIVIALIPTVAGSATLKVTASDGLQLAAGTASVEVPEIEPSQAYRVTLAATPTVEGLQMLNLEVAVAHDDTSEARSFSIPVIVASGVDAEAVTKR